MLNRQKVVLAANIPQQKLLRLPKVPLVSLLAAHDY